MTTPITPICMFCTRFRRDASRPMACDAYPDGIPTEIVESHVDHRLPFVGDQGLRFVPADAEGARWAEVVFDEE